MAVVEKLYLMTKDEKSQTQASLLLRAFPCSVISWLSMTQVAQSSEGTQLNMVYDVGELFELGIQLSYLLTLLALLGAGTFFVIRQVLVRRELDLSAKELQVHSYNFAFIGLLYRLTWLFFKLTSNETFYATLIGCASENLAF
jgi:hypothetical protein